MNYSNLTPAMRDAIQEIDELLFEKVPQQQRVWSDGDDCGHCVRADKNGRGVCLHCAWADRDDRDTCVACEVRFGAAATVNVDVLHSDDSPPWIIVSLCVHSDDNHFVVLPPVAWGCVGEQLDIAVARANQQLHTVEGIEWTGT